MFRLLKDKVMSLKLKSKLILTFMLTSISILLLFAFSFYRYTSRTLLEQSEKATLRSLSQLETNLTNTINTVNTVSRSILVSSYFSEEMKLDQINTPDDVYLVNDVYDFFTELMTNYDYIHSIVYYGDNGIIIGSSNRKNFFQYDPEQRNFFYQTALKDTLKETEEPTLCGGFRYNDFFPGSYSESQNTHYITLGRRLTTIRRQTSGYAIVNIKESYLRSLYHDDSRQITGESILLDQNSRVISSEDKNMIGTSADISHSGSENTVALKLERGDNEALNKNNQIIYYPYEEYGLAIIYEIPYSVLFENIQELKGIVAALLIVFIILSLVISLFWIYSITQPLHALIEAMKTMGSGNTGVKMEDTETSDFGFLSMHFNQMSQNIHTLLAENQLISEERQELAIQNLQSQLNPHFLYNTLNTIKWMAIVSKVNNIAECITALGSMLQPIFRNTKTIWPLHEELNYLKNYLCIMNYRTGEPVELVTEIDPAVRECLIPRFILQPLVENSLSHFTPSAEVKSIVSLHGERSGEDIILTLADNGAGIPEPLLTILKELLDSNEDCTKPLDRSSLPEGIGIGILNTNRRIKLQYGNVYGLTIDSTEGEGTCLTIRVAGLCNI